MLKKLGQPVTKRHELEQAVSTYIERAAAKMRRQHLATATLQVFVTTCRSPPPTRPKLAKAALNALDNLWRPNLRYKKAGVILLDLVPAAIVQGDLWETPDTPRTKALMRTLDRLNTIHGRDTVTLALSGRKPRWGLRSEKRSPRFTTDWDELLEVA